MRNHEVTEPQVLLDAAGNIKEPGWARRQVWTYGREQIKAPWFRIKEWDYYMVTGEDFAISLTMSDVGYMGLQSVSLFFLDDDPWVHTNMTINPFPRGKMCMFPNSDQDGINSFHDWRMALEYEKKGDTRRLMLDFPKFYKKKNLLCDITLHQPPMDTMVIATPWPKDKHFYYNQKINCMRASGFIEFDGNVMEFDPATDFATLDWGRGVWIYDNTWYWSSGNTDLNGHAFGFNLGYGFGDTTAATENIVFYDGIGHKLDDVTFEMSDPKDFEAPWKFTSSDHRFEADFLPIIDRTGKIDVGFACTDQHQIFGRMTGTAILDDGTPLPFSDVLCFVEKVRMKY